ncbi:MAG TPA: amidase family protein, partial [Chloroflexia bacterium]|nr:amidase family protein [Chloroflexia bacterium]
MQDLTTLSAGALAAAIAARQVAALDVLDAYLAQIARWNPRLNAIITLDAAGARRRAQAADAALARGESWGPLHGVPITLKDGHSTAGLRTTAGYPPLAEHVPAADGTVAARLRAAGAIILGKTNVPPLLLDIQTANPIFGRTNNPWDLARTPGGSSGGAAAALAAGLTALDIGSDYAGSIRIPAAFCGLFALKPTEHRVSMAGHIPDLPGTLRAHRLLWAIGPLARSIPDLTLAFRILAGPDGHDPAVPPVPLDDPPALALSDLRLAWAPTFPGVPVAEAIAAALYDLAAELARQGARVAQQLPDVDFGDQIRLRGLLGKALVAVAAPESGPGPPLADYFALLERRDAAIRAWDAFFGDWDAFLCPVAMRTAFPHCPPETPLLVDGVTVKYWRIIDHCRIFSLTGHPVVVVPAGLDAEGLPIGVQIAGPRWAEARLLAIAARIAAVVPPLSRPP